MNREQNRYPSRKILPCVLRGRSGSRAEDGGEKTGFVHDGVKSSWKTDMQN